LFPKKIKFNKFGKPYIPGIPYDFNITHSGDYIACGIIKNGKIGIDIEEVKPIDIFSLSNHVFSNEEINILGNIQSDNNRLKTFYKIWTLNEAYIKAHGKGISIPLKQFSFQFTNTVPEIKRKIAGDTETWHLFQKQIDTHFILSSCYSFHKTINAPLPRIRRIPYPAIENFSL